MLDTSFNKIIELIEIRKNNAYKKVNENPSVGVILCSSKDKDIVEYSLDSNMTQTMIAEYKLKLIDKKLLENKLREAKNLIDNNKK